jgi:nucleoside-diphosphate-sugar epimerase
LENVATTAETVQIAGRTGCSAWIGLGSQAEYGPANSTIDENFPLRPTTGYGEAKVEAFLRAREACHELGIRFGWLRVFSTYGPGDSLEWMIPSLVEKLLDGERPPLTMGEQLWDYLHVRDAARAVVALASSQDAHGAFNLGSGEAVKLRELIEGIRDAIDPGLPLGFGEVPYRPDQVMVLHANVDRLKSATGWQPKETLNNGLDELVASHRKARSRNID